MEELKSHFYKIFSQRDQKDNKLLWSTFFKDFSYNQECEYFELGRFLVSLILQTKTTRNDKISFLFTLISHYQNSPGNSLTVQSVQSLLEELYLNLGFLNPFPYYSLGGGRITSAILDFGPAKGTEDVTDILKTWNFLQYVHFRSRDIVLGDSGNLGVLRSLFDHNTLVKVNNQKGCRVDIYYSNNGSHFLWSVQIDRNFNIISRGEKVFGQYPEYRTPNQLTSVCETLYNCENTLCLSRRKGFTLNQLQKTISQDSILNYLLSSESKVETDLKNDKKQISFRVFVQGNRNQLYSVNRRQRFSIEGVLGRTRLQEIRKKLEQQPQIRKQIQGWAGLNVEYRFQGTIHKDQDITYTHLLSILSPTTVTQIPLILAHEDHHYVCRLQSMCTLIAQDRAEMVQQIAQDFKKQTLISTVAWDYIGVRTAWKSGNPVEWRVALEATVWWCSWTTRGANICCPSTNSSIYSSCLESDKIELYQLTIKSKKSQEDNFVQRNFSQLHRRRIVSIQKLLKTAVFLCTQITE